MNFCLILFLGEKRDSDHQKKEAVETRIDKRNIDVVLAGERNLRGVGMGIKMNERRSTLAATKETKIETMADLERERNMNDENRTAMMKEGETERGSAMIEERKKIPVRGRTEGEREEMLMEAERRGETEEETALRKETERGEEERETETEIGIGIEGEETRGDDKIYPVCKTDDHAPHIVTQYLAYYRY